MILMLTAAPPSHHHYNVSESDHASARRRFPAISLDLNSLYCLVLRTERSGPTKSFQRALSHWYSVSKASHHLTLRSRLTTRQKIELGLQAVKALVAARRTNGEPQRPANLPEDYKYDARPQGSEVVQTGVGRGCLTL